MGAPACGDVMKLQVQIEDGIIVDTKFKTFGCGSGERREKAKRRSGEELEPTGCRAVYTCAPCTCMQCSCAKKTHVGSSEISLSLSIFIPIPFPRFPSFPLSPSISLCSLALPYFLFSSSNSQLCPSLSPAIASSSLASEWIRGKTIDEVLEIKNKDIAAHLKLPPVKLHCRCVT